MANHKHIQQLVGQLFIVGFDGFSVPIAFKRFIAESNLGGVIYFEGNVQSPTQLAELSNEIQFSCRAKGSPPLVVSIDHEGGKVTRLVKPFTKFPGNDYIGDLGSPKVAFQFGMVIGKELKAIGVNMNCAPVVDVNSNPESPIIGSRAFSKDPEVCGRMGSAVCRGLQKMGVMAVAKHFPGHGGTTEDSHLALPVVTKTMEQLDELELIPFKRVIKSRVEGVMTAHIMNRNLDPEYPATLSKATLTDLLRTKMRFSRLIISDDLEMKAIADKWDPIRSAVLAVQAGCDMLIYKGEAGVPQAQIDAIIVAVEKGEIPLAQLEQKVVRIQTAKKAYCEQKEPIDITEVGQYIGQPDHAKLADIITKKEKPADEGPEDFG
ncbi:MAG: beta-N-acetylhexosaminidase [Deltaproteobacteria bacterium]|nr:beta-N-acetylhexosaminidase [Deltaproteobacteria bacterium]MBI3294839.1 beta-N-acetylhexosaminidase [Deltaproteobacteria bacterium]